MTNFDTFKNQLESQYKDLFANDPEYSYSASKNSPHGLAAIMTEKLKTGEANHDGKGIKRACKALEVKYTRKAIREYLNS